MEDEFKTDAAVLIQDAFRGLLATIFYLVPSITHDVVISGREHVGDHHPTIIVANHKRDLDSLVMAGVAYFARGISRPDRNLIFGLREDVFWPGFLADYLGWPWPFRPLLKRLDVSSAVSFIKSYPVGMLRRREHQPRMRRQLDQFVELLDRGRDLYWTPEGGLGLDGRFGRFKAGLHRLLRETSAPVHLLPMAVVYDFMTTTRTRCFIRIGPEIRIGRHIGRSALEGQARRAILAQMTGNVGHAAAATLRHVPQGTPLLREHLAASIQDSATELRKRGLHMDPRLNGRVSFRRRVGRFFGYAVRHGILEALPEGRVLVAQGLDHPKMRYVLNELEEIESLVLDPQSESAPSPAVAHSASLY
ncbi:MAG: lysophospholipid acyltransferase family protein [Chloroflexota bacterium]